MLRSSLGNWLTNLIGELVNWLIGQSRLIIFSYFFSSSLHTYFDQLFGLTHPSAEG